jgi:hypothetical protein
MDRLPVDHPAEVVAQRGQAIYQAMLRQSPNIRCGDFATIGADDLACLFDLYNCQVFDGWFTTALADKADGPLRFRVSATMTRSGGKTTRSRRRGLNRRWRDRYEIAVAGKLLFMTFHDVPRPVVVCGQACRDRLEALQRIMEHEIVHLAEFLLWGKSSCAGRRFKQLAKRIFGHGGTKHELVTPHERAAVRHGISVGSQVEFDVQGLCLVGRVNRITQRATVLVEAARGRRYTDGKTYDKYLVPVPTLRLVGG